MVIIYFFLLVYCIFIVWLLDGFKNTLKLTDCINKKTPFVSIVIAAKDESNNLSKLFDCLEKQSYPKDKYEIIIVNDKSKDDTLKIIKNCSIDNLKYIDINFTPKNWAPKKWAIYKGIEKSQGSIILQTDADCYMGKDWIRLMIKPFEDISVGFVSSLTPMLSNSNNIYKQLHLLDSIAQDIFSGYAIGKGLIFSCTARSIAFRKSYFIDVKGYRDISHILSGDDDLLMHKIVHYIGCKVKFIINKNAAVFSKPPNSLYDFFIQRLRFASKGFIYYKKEFISVELKILLPLLYILNFFISISIIKFCNTGEPLYFFPFLFKMIADYFMVYPVINNFGERWSLVSFIILSIFHPFYIISFGLLGPMLNFKWK